MKKKERIVYWLSPVVLLFVGFLVLSPLLRNGFFVSDDGNWMIIRLSAFYQSFREGQFPVRFLGRLNYSFGYPVANFLYPGFLYIGSVIHLLGFSFVNSVKLILAGSVATGALFTYFWLKKYFSSFASFIGSVVFITAPYLLFDLYHRGSVGEVLALAWGAMGLYSLASKKYWLFALSVSLIVVSHNSLAVLFLAFWLIYSIVERILRDVWLWFVVGIGMVMFFWFPAIYDQKYIVFSGTSVSNPADYFITVRNASLIGFSGILAAAVSLFLPKNTLKIFLLSVFAACVFMVLPVSGAIWKIASLSKIFQFPYRFLSLTIFLGAWLAAYVWEKQKRIARWVFACLLVGFGVWSIGGTFAQIQYTNESEGFYTTNEATTTVHDEYMPRWVVEKPLRRADQRIVFYSGRGTFESMRVTTQSVNTLVKAAEDSIIQFNTVYYPGWGATVDDIPIEINYQNNQGVMRIPIEKGTHHLVIAFRETISRFLADILSLLFFIFFIVLSVVKKAKRRRI